MNNLIDMGFWLFQTPHADGLGDWISRKPAIWHVATPTGHGLKVN
jgi:hypothetical protein